MILKKTITDNDDTFIGCTNYNMSGTDDAAIVKKKKKKTKKKKQQHSSSSSFESSSQASAECSSSSLYSTTSSTGSSTVQTDRTSLGKTIRGTYKSYSEKFLAQQEEEKQRCLLAIMEGTPLDQLNIYGNGGGSGGDSGPQLLLTNGPVDPEADIPSQYDGETATTTDGESTFCSTTKVDESFKKSSHTMGSNRRGVYGGGVQYFTPDNGKYDDDEDEEEDEVEESEEEDDDIGCSDDEDFEEEEEDDEYTHQDDYEDEYDNERENGGGEEEEGDEGSDTIELDGSDMESMFSNDDTYDHHQNSVGVDSVDDDGVDSVTTLSTAEQNEVLRHYNNGRSNGGNGGNKRRGRRAPEMTPISDDSVSSSNCWKNKVMGVIMGIY